MGSVAELLLRQRPEGLQPPLIFLAMTLCLLGNLKASLHPFIPLCLSLAEIPTPLQKHLSDTFNAGRM